MSEFRVGMCTRCGERVWLTPSGACSRGHGVSALEAIEVVSAPATPLPNTVFCRSCGAELFETVPTCGNCSSAQAANQGAAGAGSQAGGPGNPGQPGYQGDAGFSSQQWTVGGSRMGVSASILPPLSEAPDFSMLDPYYQDEFRRIYESGEMYRGKWNWAAFLFGPFWMLARDMPMVGLGIIIANIIVGIVTAGTGIPLLFFAYDVYVGIRGNYLRYTALYKRVQTFVE